MSLSEFPIRARSLDGRDRANGQDSVEFESRFVCADSAPAFEDNTRTMPPRGVVFGIRHGVTERTALADEQAALRRVATLVARESSPGRVCAAVVKEVGRIVGVDSTAMLRYVDGTAIAIASWGELALPLGNRFPLDGDDIHSRVFATARPARIDDHAEVAGAMGRTFKALGVRSAAGAPIMVGGRLWGAMIAVAAEPLPQDTESRMVDFTELVATAIANVDARAELRASRARVVAAADEERRRVVRDLHDGAQQRLVHAIITLKLAQAAIAGDAAEVESLVGAALKHMQEATRELRDLAHGILPSVLTTGGLRPAVDDLVSRTPVPVEARVCADRFPLTIESTAYFVVAEALTNITKHARAARVAITARIVDDALQVEVRDDGVGGARPDGRGLCGLADRLAALDGRLWIDSPPDGGTRVAAAIPLAASASTTPAGVQPPTVRRPNAARLSRPFGNGRPA